MRPTKLLLLVFTAFLLGCETSPPGVAPADAGPDRVDAESGGASPGFVVAYNELAREAGARILEQGGSAADAFIATTLVEYVIAPSGVTTLAGPLGVLVVEENGQVVSLEANMNAPESPEGRYDPAAPTIGDTALVPGAPRALEALSQRYGTLPWADVVEPARRIAEEGFVIDRNFAFGITSRRDVLERTEYGRETFFDAAGEPRRTGENFRQPVLAEFLARFAAEGADAVYTGAFAERFRDTVEAAGGAITLEELARYRVSFEEPWVLRYRDADVYSISGRAYGGAFVLMGLSALEHGGYSLNGRSEVDRLELLIRTARATYFEDWLFDARVAQREEVVARLA
ncbi:MAG: gamma-glutamyltransferase, partial [Myxococcota bacterium]